MMWAATADVLNTLESTLCMGQLKVYKAEHFVPVRGSLRPFYNHASVLVSSVVLVETEPV